MYRYVKRFFTSSNTIDIVKRNNYLRNKFFGKKLNGKIFNEYFNKSCFVKYLCKQHEDNIDLNKIMLTEICSNEYSFYDVNLINKYIHHENNMIAIINIPDDATVCIEKESYKTNKFKLINILSSNIFYSKFTKNELKYFLENNPYVIKYMSNPTEEEQMCVTRQFCTFVKQQTETLFEFIPNPPSNEIQMYILNQHSYMIEHIKNPSEEAQMYAIQQNPYFIKHIKIPTEKVKLFATNINGNIIEFISNPSEEVQINAIKNNINAFKYIKNPTIKSQLYAIKILYNLMIESTKNNVRL